MRLRRVIFKDSVTFNDLYKANDSAPKNAAWYRENGKWVMDVSLKRRINDKYHQPMPNRDD